MEANLSDGAPLRVYFVHSEGQNHSIPKQSVDRPHACERNASSFWFRICKVHVQMAQRLDGVRGRPIDRLVDGLESLRWYRGRPLVHVAARQPTLAIRIVCARSIMQPWERFRSFATAA